MSDIVRITDLYKNFHGREIYRSASAVIAKGSATAIVGPNGSGKSLLLRLICKFVEPDRGEVWLEPSLLHSGRQFPDKFGIIIDRPGFLEHLTGIDNLKILANIRRQIDRQHVVDTMRGFGLDPALSQKVRNYSLGMRQKLALSQAFMEVPEVLVLDEPFNALDADAVDDLRARLRRFRQDGGTIIFTSHNPQDIEEVADSVITISEGSLNQS